MFTRWMKADRIASLLFLAAAISASGRMTTPIGRAVMPPDLNSDNPAYVFEDTLPTDVRFIFNGNGAGKTDESFEVGKVGSGQWVPVVVFLPDGTASDDVQITFDCAAARSMTIQLRAITGTSTVLPRDHNSGDNSP